MVKKSSNKYSKVFTIQLKMILKLDINIQISQYIFFIKY